MFKPTRSFILLAALLATLSSPLSAAPGNADDSRDHRIGHVFVIVLENEGFDVTFGPASKAPSFSKTLTSQGVLLNQYYGTGHVSLGNYIAMLSGQAATPDTRNDCQIYADFALTGTTPDVKPSATAASILPPSRLFLINSMRQAKPGAHTWKTWAMILIAKLLLVDILCSILTI
jgi:hypothetical protein